ncbi:hypothetical protein BRADI_4g45110v3 [Brachypodium distachyon]|uniref:U1-type domain-containing protein n=1 Tax=Brachypodium distachyon TaxID=15368 RepID=A0A2K2CUA6_BRADI|nr:hypothetical protein BRADI_4g45110v3 [Brachypodium distachyon]
MDYAAQAPPAADPNYPHAYGHNPYTYAAAAYHYPDPAAAVDPSASYSYPNPSAAPVATYDPYAQYNYYGAPAYYYGAGAGAPQPPPVSSVAAEAVPSSSAAAAAAAAGREAVKHFGFDPQRYAQVAAAKAPNKMAPAAAAATSMHHAQWNAHFGHPLPKNVPRKFMKKPPKVVQPASCEVCKIQCDTLEVLMIHKTVVQAKKNKSSPASAEDLEVKKRRVLEAGAAQGEVKICTACNVVVNSQKLYEFHILGHKHKANVQKQQQVAQEHHLA